MSTFNDTFEELLATKSIIVGVAFADSESLRVSLNRRWNQYKRKMDALGFLSDEMENLSLSRSAVAMADGIVYTRFQLVARADRKTYTIVTPPVVDKKEDGNG